MIPGFFARRSMRTFSFPGTVIATFIVGFAGPVMSAPVVDISNLPPAAARPIDFTKDIQPLLERSCLKCHGPEKAKGKLLLDTREHTLQGGENGPDIIPGQSAKS